MRVRLIRKLRKSGDYSEEATPVPIPNTVVKLFCADDTWRAASREIRTSPVFSIWPHGQVVKTSPFHGGNPGSSPGGVTISRGIEVFLFFIYILELLYQYNVIVITMSANGEIGRRTRFRSWRETVGVRVPLRAPFMQPVKYRPFLFRRSSSSFGFISSRHVLI